MLDFCRPVPELGYQRIPALLVGAAILTSLVFAKAILSIGLLYLGCRECIALALWSSFVHMIPNAIICVEVYVTWETKLFS